MSQGKLIVLEGIDGSGKSVQYRQLCQRLEAEGIAFAHVGFPHYESPSSTLVKMYLNGDFGKNPSDVNAYAASTFYAVDRYASYAADSWGKYYQQGGLVLSDRYTTSNAVHQGCKLSEAELPEFFDWLYDLEYVRMGLPRPDMVIYLDVSVELSLQRMAERRNADGSKADIHEKDPHYLEQCLALGHKAAAHYGWHVVDYQKDGRILSIEEKHEEIYRLIRNELRHD